MQKPNRIQIMKNVLATMDKILCGFLGLDKDEIVPHLVEKKGNNIIIVNTESYKRHAQKIPINNINLGTMNNENREKLGQAIGKAIATNLVVSFENIPIKRDNNVCDIM